MTPQAPTGPVPSKSQAMATTALVLGIVGLCLPVLIPFTLVVAIVVLATGREGKGFAIAGLVLAVVAIPIFGILAAIAIPNFIRFQARSKQSECKTYLKSAYTAARTYQQEHEAVVADFSKLGFSVMGNNRYLYVADPGVENGLLKADPTFRLSQEKALRAVSGLVDIGVTGACPKCSLTVACVGNVDNDEFLDIWSVSTAPREHPLRQVDPGELFQHQDDPSDRVEEHLTFSAE